MSSVGSSDPGLHSRHLSASISRVNLLTEVPKAWHLYQEMSAP